MTEEKTNLGKESFEESSGTQKHLEESSEKHRRAVGRWRIVSFVLLLCCLALVVAIIAISFTKDREMEEIKTPPCDVGAQEIDLSEPENPSVFSDLTTTEVKGLMDFLYSQESLNLVKPDQIRVNASYMFLAELYLPNKHDVISYLDNPSGNKPDRMARVVIFRGDLVVPDIMEIKVYPLPKPSKYDVLKENIPFIYRPLTGPEYSDVLQMITDESEKHVRDLLLESYGATLKDCGDKCLVFRYITPVSPAASGEESRLIWFWMSQFVDYYILHPIDFSVLVQMEGPKYTIRRVWYNNKAYDSLTSLADQYKNNIVKQSIPFPEESNKLFSKLAQRGDKFPNKEQRPPMQVEPDGKRYSVRGQHVKYMNWDFDFRMSTSYGPQLYDVRYQDKRIIYELGTQEISVFYSGYKPNQMFANYLDSCGVLGSQAKGLVPGVDCPAHATLIPVRHVLENSEQPVKFENVFCLFEHDIGIPLRRHQSFSTFHGSFYEGMPGTVLILRTAIVVVNYDYIVDYIFYQNGAIQVRAISTGYILATPFTPDGKMFGVQVHKNLSGNLHHHMFSFKADLDINGLKNRYDTLDISTKDVPNNFNANPNARFYEGKYTRNTKKSELEAAYRYNFNTPKYHIVYGNLEKDKYGNPKSYRILMKGMSKQILPEGIGNEPAIPWMRYQMAVTKQKDMETSSSSLYSMFDAKDPVVNFQSFLNDNETILDEDLVLWISMGIQHIPHTEDLPVTHTPGMDLSFFLLPYNYFPEDPAVASRDSIRIEPKEYNNPNSGVNFIRHNKRDNLQCVPPKNDYEEKVKENPGILLEYGDGGNTAI